MFLLENMIIDHLWALFSMIKLLAEQCLFNFCKDFFQESKSFGNLSKRVKNRSKVTRLEKVPVVSRWSLRFIWEGDSDDILYSGQKILELEHRNELACGSRPWALVEYMWLKFWSCPSSWSCSCCFYVYNTMCLRAQYLWSRYWYVS